MASIQKQKEEKPLFLLNACCFSLPQHTITLSCKFAQFCSTRSCAPSKSCWFRQWISSSLAWNICGITAKASAGFLLDRILAPESFCSHPHTASECLSCRQAVRGECRSSKLHCLDGDMGRSGLVAWDAWTRKCCPGPGWKVVVLLLFVLSFVFF